MNPTYILSGSLEKQQSKGSKSVFLLYIEPHSRVLSIQNNEVSSVAGTPDKAVNKITDENKNSQKLFLAVISSQESDNQYIARVSKLKVVRKNGKNMLRMAASSSQLDASGKYAQDCINLDEIPQGKVNMTILSDNELTTSSIVEDWFDVIFQRITYKNAFASVSWRRLPGAPSIESGSQWNWYYIAKQTKDNKYLALKYEEEDKFIFKGVDKNGDITNQAGFTRSDLPQNMSTFGIDDFETWKRQYGVLFGLQSW